MSYGSLTYVCVCCVCVCCVHTHMQRNKDWMLHSLSFSLCVSLPPIFQSVYFNSADQSIFPFRYVLSALFFFRSLFLFFIFFFFSPPAFRELMGGQLKKEMQPNVHGYFPSLSSFFQCPLIYWWGVKKANQKITRRYACFAQPIVQTKRYSIHNDTASRDCLAFLLDKWHQHQQTTSAALNT